MIGPAIFFGEKMTERTIKQPPHHDNITPREAARAVKTVVEQGQWEASNLSDLAFKHGTDKGTAQPEGNPLSPKAYTEIYAKFFDKLRLTTNCLLEIGVWKVASLRMWEEYFPNAQIIGIDNKETCRQYETKRIKIAVGSQSDKGFLGEVVKSVPGDLQRLDVIIDDGSHLPKDQQASFEALFPYLRPGGFYCIEDLRTHYATTDNIRDGLSLFSLLVSNLHQINTTYPIGAINLYKGLAVIQKRKRNIYVEESRGNQIKQKQTKAAKNS